MTHRNNLHISPKEIFVNVGNVHQNPVIIIIILSIYL